MGVIRFFLKIALLPVVVVLTVVQWFFIFLIGFSSMVFNMLAGLFQCHLDKSPPGSHLIK